MPDLDLIKQAEQGTLLTLSDCLSPFATYVSASDHTHHEPFGHRLATIDLHIARVRPALST
jgi:hypothetical protein